MSRQSSAMSSLPLSTTTIIISQSSKILSKNSQKFLNNEDIIKVMERKLGKKNFIIKYWSLDPIEGTNGFMGQYFNLRVTCKTNNNENLQKFIFFAKAKPPNNSPQFDFALRSDVMNKEIRAYEELMPLMGAGNGMDWKVDSYLGKKDVILVLEDATLDGYSMPDKYLPFGYEEYIVLIRSLAKLHSKSLILEDKLQREEGKTVMAVYGDLLEESLFPHDDSIGGNIVFPSVQGACSMVDLVENFDDSSKNIVKNRIKKWSQHMPNLLQSSKKYRNVICHRDVWANNFMIKRDHYGHPEGCYLVDFQFLSYLPPAADFMLSLHLNTRHNTRLEYFEAFTKIYYDCLSNEVKHQELDIDSLISWNEFRSSCESYRSLAIIYVTINQQIMLIDQSSADKYFTHSPELLDWILRGPGRPEMVCNLFKNSQEYRERFTENVFDIYRWLSDDIV